MSFSVEDLAREVPAVRVVIADVKGSVPRGVGTAMIVTNTGVFGTIGGGTLEFEAIKRARDVMASQVDRVDRVPLGPGVGQCCGGAVTLVTEYWDAARLAGVEDVVARVLPGGDGAMPVSVQRVLTRGADAAPGLMDGWLIEPVVRPERDIWIWGAGHVGRAIVGVLAPLPEFRIFWADFDAARFPEVPAGVETLVAEDPAELVSLASDWAEHFVTTHSHALDLELCHRILGRQFRFAGLIGSETKWARFRSRLSALGHSKASIDRIACPIGDPGLGKHPQAIALGVATGLIMVGLEGGLAMERSA